MSEKQTAKNIIIKALKNDGMDIAEDSAIKLVKTIYKTLPIVFMSTKNPFDDLLIPIIKMTEPKVLKLLDRIDGEEG